MTEAKRNTMTLVPLSSTELATLQEKGEEATTTLWQPEPHWPNDEELLRRAVHGCIGKWRPRWAFVMQRLGIGSTMAQCLCRRFDVDPEQQI